MSATEAGAMRMNGISDVTGAFDTSGHEQVSIATDPAAGYRGVIAIHSTALGPAVGGTRFWNYASDAEAIADALRLSKAMTYKAALAGLDYGGGKSVVIGDPMRADRRRLFHAHGRHVEWLGGRYIAGEDVNTSPSDMAIMHEVTAHVAGLADRSGDPSPYTALGVFRGIQACAQHRYGDSSLAGRRVIVQGVGNVGYNLCRHLHVEGARLIVADANPDRTERARSEFAAQVVPPAEALAVEADVLAPCALGGVIDDRSVDRLRVDIVAGAANNQLADPRLDRALEKRGIVYAPDYLINAGGLMTINIHRGLWDADQCRREVSEIYTRLLDVLTAAQSQGLTASAVADRLVEDRLAGHSPA
jgi:leucine dehydrogenase